MKYSYQNYLPSGFLRAYFIDAANSDISQLFQVLFCCLQSSVSSLTSHLDGLLVRLSFSLVLLSPSSLSLAFNSPPPNLPAGWEIIPFNQSGFSTAIKTGASVILTSALQSNEWFSGVYVLEGLLELWRRQVKSVVHETASPKFDNLIFEDVPSEDDHPSPIITEARMDDQLDDVEAVLLGAIYRLLTLLEFEWDLEGLMQFFPTSVMEVWKMMRTSRKQGLQKICAMTPGQLETARSTTLGQLLNAELVSSKSDLNASLLADMRLQSLQSLCKYV